ncbi:MAG: hypothetical protein JXC85_05590 [Candidatus Aenigmarchaeota archaeon]|nr:hypothetical protein [Candidatus Aenigmarchaeota archaeon]
MGHEDAEPANGIVKGSGSDASDCRYPVSHSAFDRYFDDPDQLSPMLMLGDLGKHNRNGDFSDAMWF